MAVATLACNAAGIAGYESAALLHQVDGNWGEPLVLLLIAPRRIHLERVTVHVGPLDPADVVEIDGIPCTNLERTLCDLGSVINEFALRLAFEWYWRARPDLATLQAAVDRLHRPGQHGTKAIQELIVDSRLKGRATESALEVRLDTILSEIEGVVRQYEVRDADGRFVARVDFAIPELRLAIEAHSRQFHDSPEAIEKDEARHERLIAADWRTQYVTSAEMRDPCKVRSTVRALARTGAAQPVPRFEPIPSGHTSGHT
ncbi:MAG: hypothetical protein ACOYMR_08865, partial [Ilumatobacteraceae bacterium]